VRYFIITILLPCLTIVPPAFASAEPAVASKTEPSDHTSNAALQYWQAFAQMPPMAKEQEKLLAEWRTVSLDDPAVKKLVDESHNSMMYLRRAARCKYCDWGLDYSEGISLMLPHLAKARDLARLAALNTRYECERGNRGVLPQNASAMMVLARHVARDPFMISLLVQFGIEGYVVDLVAPYIPEVNVPYAEAAKMFERLPAAPDVHQSVGAEKKYFLDWLIRELREEEARSPGAGLKLWKNFLGPDGPADLLQIDSFDEAETLVEQLLPVYDELQTIVGKPKPEFDAVYPKFKERVNATEPLAKHYLPAIDEILSKERRNKARLAMLIASIAVVEGGPEKLKSIKDPYGDGPFEYKVLDKGFELRSKLVFEDKPVTLVLGKQ
jgi:hypothetical protein